jgi:hypothetical protein
MSEKEIQNKLFTKFILDKLSVDDLSYNDEKNYKPFTVYSVATKYNRRSGFLKKEEEPRSLSYYDEL